MRLVLSGFADGDEPDTGEDQDYGQGFRGSEAVQTEADAGEGRYYGLDVVVHSHQRWPQTLLAYHHADICQERAAYHHIPDSAPFQTGDRVPVGGCKPVDASRQRNHGR